MGYNSFKGKELFKYLFSIKEFLELAIKCSLVAKVGTEKEKGMWTSPSSSLLSYLVIIKLH
jgi:hypothetical protein